MTEQPGLSPSKERSGWYSLGGYILLSLAAYWPLCLHLLDYPSKSLPEFDLGQYFWNIWWTWRQLIGLESIYTCSITFYPEGTNLAFSTLHLFNTLFILPFQAMGVPQLGYNLVFLASGAFSGWGVYLLCRDLKVPFHAAWLAGALFLLAPYRFGQIDHFNLINTVPIPFYLLWMRRAVLSKGWKNPILWGLWLFITANTSWYYLFFLLCLSPFYLLHILYTERMPKSRISGIYQTLRAAGVFLLLFLPQFLALINGYESGQQERPIGAMVYWSADLLQLIVPSFLLKSMPESGEFNVYPGMVTAALVLLVLFQPKQMKGKFWLALAFGGALLSLGPVLKIGGHLTGFWLPGYWIEKVPLLGAMRTMARWSLLYQLGLIVFLATNFARVEKLWRNRLQIPSWSPLVVIVILVFFENYPGMFPHSPAQFPDIIRELPEIDAEGVVLHLPEGEPKEAGRYIFLQTLHGLPLCNGYPLFRPSLSHLTSYPAVALLNHQAGFQLSDQEILNDLKELKIGWIILHPEYFQNKHEIQWLDTILTQKFQAHCLHRDQEIWVYHLQREYDTVPPHPQAQDGTPGQG